MARRPRSTPARALVIGSEADLARIEEIARTSLAKEPALAHGAERVLSSFVRDTARARARATAGSSAQEARRGDGRTTPALGVALLIITVLSACVAAVVPIPAREGYDIDPALSTLIGASAAIICILAVTMGSALPPAGSPESRTQAWKTLYVSAGVLGVGLVAGAFGLGEIVASATPLWAAWFGCCVLALVATISVAEVRRRQERRRPVSSVGVRAGSDEEFFSSIAGRKAEAVRELEVLGHGDGTAAAAWKTGIAAALAGSTVTRVAAEEASRVSAQRWLIEWSAQPEYGARE